MYCITTFSTQRAACMHACRLELGLGWTGPDWTRLDWNGPDQPMLTYRSSKLPNHTNRPRQQRPQMQQSRNRCRFGGLNARQIHTIYCLPVCWLTGLLACWSTKYLTLSLVTHGFPITNVHVRVYACICAYVYVYIYVCACLCHLECLSNKACPLCDESGASQQLPIELVRGGRRAASVDWPGFGCEG